MRLGEPLVWASSVVITFLYMPRKSVVFSAILPKTTKFWESFINSFCRRPKTLTAGFFRCYADDCPMQVSKECFRVPLGSRGARKHIEMKLHSRFDQNQVFVPGSSVMQAAQKLKI